MDSASEGQRGSLPPAPGWLPLLVGGLFLYTGLVRSYLGVGCFAYGSVDSWLFDLTRHWNIVAICLGAAVLLPPTRSPGSVLVGGFAAASIWVVLYLKLSREKDIGSLALFGPVEMPLAGQIALSLGLLAASGWMLRGGSSGKGTGLPTRTVIPWVAAAAFLLTAFLKLTTTLSPPGCLWVIEDEAGNLRENPLYPWLWWGGRLAIIVEAAIAYLLLRPGTRTRGAWLGAGFVAFAASALVAVTVVTGKDPTSMCGCFGPIDLPLPAHLTFDGLLLGLLLWTMRLSRTPSPPST